MNDSYYYYYCLSLLLFVYTKYLETEKVLSPKEQRKAEKAAAKAAKKEARATAKAEKAAAKAAKKEAKAAAKNITKNDEEIEQIDNYIEETVIPTDEVDNDAELVTTAPQNEVEVSDDE